jgi:hypothetical protein
MTTTDCFHHGAEPIPVDCYRICFECGHAYTVASLLAEHNRVTAELDAIDEAERAGRPTWDRAGKWIGGPLPTVPATPEANPEFVYVCPLCAHDF